MNVFRMIVLAGLAFLATSAIAEDEGISNVKCRQRWPWSSKVDITCDYAGGATTSVVFTATWSGQTEPVTLLSMDPDDACELKPGANRFAWDPVLAGYGDRAFSNFKVEAAVTNADPRTYLVVDLKNGGYSFLATPPSGGWTDEYKLTKLVFRRIPKGVYQLGTSEYGQMRPQFGNNGVIGRLACHWEKHTVTYTADYYFQVFYLTGSQYCWLYNGNTDKSTSVKPAAPSGMSYAAYRGATLDDGVTPVCWPTTGHRVNMTSLVGKLRALTSKTGQQQLLADLPTDQQWHLAKSGGVCTFLPNGGVYGDEQSYLNSLYLALSWPKNEAKNNPVGMRDCNQFGIYDYCVYPEPLLDWVNADGFWNADTHLNPKFFDPGDRFDYPGIAEPYPNIRYRLLGGTYNNESDVLGARQTIYMRLTSADDATNTYIPPRFVINLKPIVE